MTSCCSRTPPKRSPTKHIWTVEDRSDWNTDSESELSTVPACHDADDRSGSSKRQRTRYAPRCKVAGPKRELRPEIRTRESSYDSDITNLTETSFCDSCSVGSWSSKASSSEGEDFPGLVDNDFVESATRINPLLTLRFDDNGKWTHQRPRLIFRAFEPSHGLRARAFQHTSAAVHPLPDRKGDKFKQLARQHLVQDTEFSSPFLSFTQSPKRALGRHLLEGSTPREMAILDYNVLEGEMKERYGQDAGPWLVTELCKKYKWDDLQKLDSDNLKNSGLNKRGGYKGTCEFLVWGMVLCEPVGVLTHKECLRLHGVMEHLSESESKVGYEAGLAINPCLQGVHNIYKAVVARKLLNAFKISGYKRGHENAAFEAFVRGVYNEPDEYSSAELYEPRSLSIADVPSASRKKAGALLQSLKQAKTVRIVIEIPPRIAPTNMNTKPSSCQASDDSLDPEESLQQMVDAQLSEMGSGFGVIVEPFTTSSALSNHESKKIRTKVQNYHGVPVAHQVEMKKRIVEEETDFKKVVRNPDIVNHHEHEKGNKQPHSDIKLDPFTKELLENALIPSPTPPPQIPDKLTGNTASLTPFAGVASSKSSFQASSRVVVDLTTEDDNDDEGDQGNDADDEDELMVIAEAKVQSRSYIRTTTRTRTTTLTVRSRSLSQSIIFNPRG